MTRVLSEKVQGRSVVVVVLAMVERVTIARIGGGIGYGGIGWADVGVRGRMRVMRGLDVDWRRRSAGKGLRRVHVVRHFRNDWLGGQGWLRGSWDCQLLLLLLLVLVNIWIGGVGNNDVIVDWD